MSFGYEVKLLPKAGNNFGKLHSIDGIIFHTTEGGGSTRQDALNTINYQKSNPGSYNFIVYDGGAFLTVPYLEASGGINPSSTAWAPERFSFLKSKLDKPCPTVPSCPGAYKNPTMHHLQASFSGRRNVLDAGGPIVDRLVQTALDLRDWYSKDVAGKSLVISGHMHWQSNRSDPGKVFTILAGPTTQPGTPKEEEVIQIIVEKFPSPVKFKVAAGTTLKGYDPEKGLVKTMNFPNASGASADAYHTVSHKPTERVPYGKTLHVLDGAFAGLLITPSVVELDPIPSPCPPAVCEEAREKGQKEGADAVRRAAVDAAAKFGV